MAEVQGTALILNSLHHLALNMQRRPSMCLRMRTVAVCALLTLLFAPLFSPAQAGQPMSVRGADITGTWSGSWESDYYDPGYDEGFLILKVNQSGSILSGTMDLGNTECGDVRNIPFSGSVENNVVSFTATYYCEGVEGEVRSQGSLSGTTMSGRYQLYADGRPYDSGSWTLSNPALKQYVTIQGNVTGDGVPLCAMVLANGQHMFTCGKTLPTGQYSLQVPLDPNDQVTIFSFCANKAPYDMVITPSGSQVTHDISLPPGGDGGQLSVSQAPTVPVGGDTYLVSGEVKIGGKHANVMVLANGQFMFTSGKTLPKGFYSLEAPLDSSGKITLQIFAKGQPPFREDIEPLFLTMY